MLMPMQTHAKKIDHAKRNGVHYTPPGLAEFLANVTAEALRTTGTIRVLDPACGDGGLLVAMVNAVPDFMRCRMVLEGFEMDATELEKADSILTKLNVSDVRLHNEDFLSANGVCEGIRPRGLFDEETSHEEYDAVIANPPYVRTQVLGAKKAQGLARKFGLTGRVDLYHAFALGMMSVLKPNGVLGLLTSNRFLTIRSGATLREVLSTQFEIDTIYDLGDTRLFEAAVLPVVIVAHKGKAVKGRREFHRIYEHRNGSLFASAQRPSVLAALRDDQVEGVVKTPQGVFQIERGALAIQDDIWTLSNTQTSGWLATVQSQQAASFGELAKVRVGIKTTADDVFVRNDWDSLPVSLRPEPELLRPLLTHREAARWLPAPAARKVVYPHKVQHGRRRPVNLARFPRAANYFGQHRDRLTSRSYVIEGGREWYEIWVPHNPADWSKPKIAYPDISEHPRFFFDATGAVIQGDCYWITLNDGIESDWLLLLLAVANSTFITKYYDAKFHNKLYSGRRRFMTQYVAKFPLPELRSDVGQEIVAGVKQILRVGSAATADEQRINRLVWQAFGLSEEIPWQGDL
jgi:hypothetical protein